MTPRILYLHLGPAKTGTSALQKVARSRSFKTLYYPSTGQWNDGAHHRLVVAFDGRETLNGQKIEPFDQQMRALRHEIDGLQQNVLISSEGISVRRNLRSLLNAFKDMSETCFDKVELIFTLRHPLDRAASGYNQGVKDWFRGHKVGPNTYLRSLPQVYTLSGQVRLLHETGLKVHYVQYGPDTVSDIFNIMGENVETKDVPVKINPSLGLFDLFAHYIFNNIFPNPGARKDAYDKMVATGEFDLRGDVSFLFSEEATEHYRRELLEADKSAFAAYNISYPTQSSLQSTDISKKIGEQSDDFGHFLNDEFDVSHADFNKLFEAFCVA